MAEDKETEKTEGEQVEDPKRAHYLTIRMEEHGGRIVGDVTGVSDLEAVKMLEGVLETLDCNLPEVVIVRDGNVVYSSNSDDGDDEED